MKIKRRKSDILYSQYLRKLRNYTCEKCGRKYQEGDGLYGLHVSHFYGRARESVRFDEENTDLLCFGCHQRFTASPNEYVVWKEHRMGKNAFQRLVVRANTLGKRDDKLMVMAITKLLEKVEK